MDWCDGDDVCIDRFWGMALLINDLEFLCVSPTQTGVNM